MLIFLPYMKSLFYRYFTKTKMHGKSNKGLIFYKKKEVTSTTSNLFEYYFRWNCL